MSIYKPKGSPYYQYDFQCGGRRFLKTTKCKSRREAEAVERQAKEEAKAMLKSGPDNAALMTLDDVAGTYMVRVGQHNACADETRANLERLLSCPHFPNGSLTLLNEITDTVVANGVAWRRGQRRWGRKDAPLVSNATVNRSFTEVLQKLFTFAKKKRGARFSQEPNWNEHMLSEPGERVRELRSDEAAALDLARRSDYAVYLDFVHASGQRGYKECLIRWDQVDWDTRLITTKGKQDRTVTIPITDEIEAILLRCGETGADGIWKPYHPVSVHTYIAARTDRRKGIVKGRRYPITREGAKTAWRRTRERAVKTCASVASFRLHDLRHDLGTKLLRETGNLKLVQRALNHADIKTTTRYAHVADDEVRAALEIVQTDQKSRNMSRTASKKVG